MFDGIDRADGKHSELATGNINEIALVTHNRNVIGPPTDYMLSIHRIVTEPLISPSLFITAHTQPCQANT